MTSAADTTSDRHDAEATPDPPGIFRIGSGVVVRAHFAVATLFLLGGLALYGLAAGKLAWPELLEGTALLGYGRVYPMATNLLLFGWLTVALVGVTYHVVPRVLGVSLERPLVALGNLVLMAGSVALGAAAVGLGESSGRRYLEMPWFSDATLTASFLVTALLVTRTARRGDRGALPTPAWYLVAAPWWLFLSYAVGAVPGLGGVPAEIQTAFASTAVFGLWAAAAGVGAGYYLIGRLVAGATFNPTLGRVGFWSLAFTWAWTSGVSLQYGPTNGWVGTIPVVFSAGLAVAVVTIATDLAGAMRGRWEALRGSLPLRLYVAGGAVFVLLPLQMFVQSLRSASAVIRFTRFEAALEIAALLGAFSLWAMALIVHVLTGEGPRRPGGWLGRLVLWPTLVGLAVAVISRWVGGLQQGYAWLAGVESRAFDNSAEGFRFSSASLGEVDLVQVVGIGLVALGVLGFAALVARHSWVWAEAEPAPSAWAETYPLKVVLRGAVLLFLVAALGTFVFPAAEAGADPSLLAMRSRDHDEGSLAHQGRLLYVAEGCMYCHTMQVRPVVTDVGLGRVSVAGDYAFDPAGTLGVQRVGPDLAHAGSREPTANPRWVLDHLVDPRRERPWSIMPSYRHLTEGELTALAVYVAGLE